MNTPMDDILTRLEQIRVVPVIAMDDLDHALHLADALLEGGLPVAEITFRTVAAAEVIQRLHERRPELLLGAGTVLTVAQLDLARAAGAAFGLSPGLDPMVVAAARRADFSFYPGVMTPSDVMAGLALGTTAFKFFPAVPAGGLTVMRAILAPFAHLNPRVIPTGGVTSRDLREWLDEPAVVAVGGTWIASRQAMEMGDWRGIRERARAATVTAAEAG